MIADVRVNSRRVYDEAAERGVIGCSLWGFKTDELDPSLIVSDVRQLLYLALDSMHAEGTFVVPATCSVRDELATLYVNAERCAWLVSRSQFWPQGVDPRVELKLCIDSCSMRGEILEFYIERLQGKAHLRQEIASTENRLRMLYLEAC